jgi:glutamate-ammonia-ligase adenylyltransferase
VVATLAVLAMGKLGGRELGYASDLDVIFVYSGDGETDGPRPLDNVTFMSRLAQRLMGGLHSRHDAGRLYEVDTRLRPSGSQGLLVSSLSGWERYHREKGALWERQALTKLRPVAGDEALCARVQATATECVYGQPPNDAPDDLAKAIHAMRERIEEELGGSIRGQDVKVGRGGLIDIEFAAQYLQICHGHEHTGLRTPTTLDALAAAAEAGLSAEDALTMLMQAYEFMRGLEHRMRIVHDRAVHRLPEDPTELEKLARRANFPDALALQQAFERWTHAVRIAYRTVLNLKT